MSAQAAPLVYLVDDNDPFRRSTAMLLETAGMDVRDFGGAAELLAQLECAAVPGLGACTVSDIRMPGMSGLELQRRLVASRPGVPVIFMTAHDDAGTRSQALSAGAVGYLIKPFTEEALLDAVRAALGST